MEILRCNPEEYKEQFPTPSHIFNTVEFNELNRHKCDDLHYLLFKDDKSKTRFGIILGEKNGVLKSPFSAPFGGMESRGRQRISQYLEAAKALKKYIANLNVKTVITLPPNIYVRDANLISQFQAFMSVGGRVVHSDYNYHYQLNNGSSIIDNFWPNAKRNLKTALNNSFEFVVVDKNDIGKLKAIYDIVYENHTGLGYPVHLSFEDILEMNNCFQLDFFLVSKDGKNYASAIIYHTSPSNMQLIYWGDKIEYRALRPMNFLSYSIIEHYKNDSSLQNFDLGPSSSDGLPSLGLCDFKASLGCHLTPKFTLEL